MENYGIDASYVKYLANKTAREEGFNVATKIKYKNCKKPYVSEFTDFGYRKYTTNEYVFNAYRNKFGWKNTYYQCAECTVVLPMRYKKIAERL